MELVEGEPLRGPMPWKEAARHLADVCDALAAAHRKGIVHRDLKPGNVTADPPFVPARANVGENLRLMGDAAGAIRDPLLANIRQEPRFRQIVDGIRYRQEHRKKTVR
jgi:hypothetical protein